MKRQILAIVTAAVFSTNVYAAKIISFDTDWRFVNGDQPGAQALNLMTKVGVLSNCRMTGALPGRSPKITRWVARVDFFQRA